MVQKIHNLVIAAPLDEEIQTDADKEMANAHDMGQPRRKHKHPANAAEAWDKHQKCTQRVDRDAVRAMQVGGGTPAVPGTSTPAAERPT
jgi:hypothetical protein